MDSTKPYYIYAHYTLDTNELFYIGKGKGKRAAVVASNRRNRVFVNIHKIHGSRYEILLDNLEDDEAYYQERLAIMHFKPRANIHRGGNSIILKEVLGLMTKEQKAEANKKRSDASKRMWANPEYKARVGKKISESLMGKKLSPEHKKKALDNLKLAWATPRSEEVRARVGYINSIKQKGKKLSPEHINNIKEAKRRNQYKHTKESNLKRAISRGSKLFNVYRKDDNSFVGEWINIEECARDIGSDGTRINRCLKNKSKSANGFVFRYKEEST